MRPRSPNGVICLGDDVVDHLRRELHGAREAPPGPDLDATGSCSELVSGGGGCRRLSSLHVLEAARAPVAPRPWGEEACLGQDRSAAGDGGQITSPSRRKRCTDAAEGLAHRDFRSCLEGRVGWVELVDPERGPSGSTYWLGRGSDAEPWTITDEGL